MTPGSKADASRFGTDDHPLRIQSHLKSDQLAGELENRILGGALQPGDRLPTEDELGEIFSVSRSVIRDAVRQLVARGLVTVQQGRGTTVAEPSDVAFASAALALLARSGVTVGDVIDARAMLEVAIVPLAADAGTEEDWVSLEQTYERFAKAVEHNEWNTARDAHLEFHLGLLRALHHPALQLLLRPMLEVIWLSSEPPRVTHPADWEVETHWPILLALKSGDAAATEEAVREHYRVLEDNDRYGSYRSKPFSTVFATPAVNELLVRR